MKCVKVIAAALVLAVAAAAHNGQPDWYGGTRVVSLNDSTFDAFIDAHPSVVLEFTMPVSVSVFSVSSVPPPVSPPPPAPV